MVLRFLRLEHLLQLRRVLALCLGEFADRLGQHLNRSISASNSSATQRATNN
jgi:hypothetical protein